MLFDGVQVPHYNYVGDSVLGYKAHMGAGSITSNVKSDKSLVVVKVPGAPVETGRKKVGAMLGDYAEVGCNSVLNPGTWLAVMPRSIRFPVCGESFLPTAFTRIKTASSRRNSDRFQKEAIWIIRGSSGMSLTVKS